MGPAQHATDASLGAAAFIDASQANLHRVAVHGVKHHGRRDEHVAGDLRDRLAGNDKAVAVAVTRQAPGNRLRQALAHSLDSITVSNRSAAARIPFLRTSEAPQT